MNTDREQLLHEIERSYDRTLLLGVVGFFAVVLFAIIFPFNSESTLYWFFGLAITLLLVTTSFIYRLRTEPLRTAVMAADMAEVAIRSSRDLFSQVYKNSPVPYLLVHPDGTVDSCNTAAVRLFRRHEDQLIQQNIFSFLTSARAAHVDIVRERLTHGIALSNEEFEVVTTDADTRAWVLLSLFFFTDVRQRRLGLLTLVDITKQKEIDVAKSEFVSLASHQLRTPIAGMRWNTELLMYDSNYPLPPEQLHKAARLMKSIDRLSSLVDDFLNVSRFELGDLVANPEVVDLRLFLEDIVSEQQSVIAHKQLVLEIPPPEQLAIRFVTDAKLLGMITTNFLVNAIKYTPTGGTIRLGVRRDTDTLAITLADTGIGIPVAEQRYLFTKMFRASNAQTQITDGTGLGLYIAKRAAQVLRGHVSYTSGEGVGSAFTVTVPLETV